MTEDNASAIIYIEEITMILIINKSKKDARDLAEMFHYMGTLAYAATPTDALSETSNIYSAIIIMKPESLPCKEDFCARLRSYVNTPIFALTDLQDLNDSIIFDGVMKLGTYASRILDFIFSYTENRSIKSPGTYKLAGIDASAYFNIPMYFNKPLPFTKTETMILRTLITMYPTPANSKDILKYAFRQSKVPELSNIRTHISVMNKKFREITGRNIITLSTGEGYLIQTPEIMSVI